MQYRVLKRQTLEFACGGGVAHYDIKQDYIVMNNSIIDIYEPATAEVGDLIALIKTSGAYVLGCITAIDEAALKISFKDCKEFFAGRQLNPARFFYANLEADEEIEVWFDSVSYTKGLLEKFFFYAQDEAMRLPLEVAIAGEAKMLWTYEDNDFDFIEYLLDIFNKRNVVLQFSVSFNRERRLRVSIFQNTNAGALIKDNVHLMTLDVLRQKLPDYTVCIVLNSTSKEQMKTWYLLADDTITGEQNNSNRVMPPRITTVEYDTDKPEITPYMLAENALTGNIFNHNAMVRIDKNTNMLDISQMRIGDRVRLKTRHGETDTVYTGLAETDIEAFVTLTFGRARVNYTDVTTLGMRKLRRLGNGK